MITLRTYGDAKDYARTIGVSVNELFADNAELFEAVDWTNEGMSQGYLMEQKDAAEADLDRLEFEMRVFRKYGYEVPEQLSDEYNAASRRFTEACWKIDINN